MLDVLHGGEPTAFAEIWARCTFGCPVSVLRALAAEGYIVCPGGGSLDDEPRHDALFRITDQGEAIFGHLLRLRAWMATRAPAGRSRL